MIEPAEVIPFILQAVLEHQLGGEQPETPEELHELLVNRSGPAYSLSLEKMIEILAKRGLTAKEVEAGWHLMVHGQAWLQ